MSNLIEFPTRYRPRPERLTSSAIVHEARAGAVCVTIAGSETVELWLSPDELDALCAEFRETAEDARELARELREMERLAERAGMLAKGCTREAFNRA